MILSYTPREYTPMIIYTLSDVLNETKKGGQDDGSFGDSNDNNDDNSDDSDDSSGSGDGDNDMMIMMMMM